MDLFCVECLKEAGDPEAVRQASYLVGGTSLCTEHAARAAKVPSPSETEPLTTQEWKIVQGIRAGEDPRNCEDEHECGGLKHHCFELWADGKLHVLWRQPGSQPLSGLLDGTASLPSQYRDLLRKALEQAANHVYLEHEMEYRKLITMLGLG